MGRNARAGILLWIEFDHDLTSQHHWNDGNWIGIAIPQPNFFGGRDAIDHDAPDGGFLK